LNVVTTVPVVATVVGGAVVNMSFAGVPPVTTTVELVGVSKLFDVSEAVSKQLPEVPSVTAANVARPVPDAMETWSVPPMVHPADTPTVMVSVGAEVTTFPLRSSIATLKVVRAVPAVAVPGGATLNPSFVAVPGFTVKLLLS
jgi:hypothetical protein